MKRYLILVRAAGLMVAADAPKGDADKDLKKLEGTWVMVSGVDDGKKLGDDAIKGARLTFEGDKHTVKEGDTTYKGTQKLDATRSPKTIDITDTEGPYKGKTIMGVYELKGDEFRLCYDPSGKGRPKDFEAKAGSGYRCHVWKREKK